MLLLSKSNVTSASALLSILLSSLPTAQAASASLLLYPGNSCSDTGVVQFKPVLGGDSGCSNPYTVEHFRSARLEYSEGLSAVLICAQGYSCDSKQSNLIPYTGECVSSPGTFDKVQICH